MIPDGFSFETSTVHSQIDPHIQMMKFYRYTSRTFPAFHIAPSGLIAIIAKVTDLNLWKALPDVQTKVEIPLSPEENAYIVTARVNIDHVDHIVDQSFVISLKVAQAVKPTLKNTLKETGLIAKTPPALVENLKNEGEGTVVGIVDYGCDFRHEHFIDKQGKTRLIALWDQTKATHAQGPYKYGREYLPDEINKAIQAKDPYKFLDYDPGDKAHGTHVMDIAAGHGTRKNSPGVAPKSQLVFVDLKSDTDFEDDRATAETDMGDSVTLVEAVKYIFDKAVDKPCVINLSLGTYGGPHDGTTPVERAFDALLKQKPNRAIVIAAGNSYNHQNHCDGIVTLKKPFDLKWKIGRHDKTRNEVEIWYSKTDEFELEILNLEGNTIGRVGLGKQTTIFTQTPKEQRILMYILHMEKDPDNHDRVIHILQDPCTDYKTGIWTLRLHGKKIASNGGKFHAWIERDDPSYPSLFVNSTTNYTLGTFATGHKTLVVGSYDAHVAGTPISIFSSAGPTRDERQKPEIIAPGGNVLAAASRTKSGVMYKPGTSMAAPAVAGLVARIFGLAQSKNIQLTIDQTRDIVKKTCRLMHGQTGYDPQKGFGKMSANALIHPLIGPTGIPQGTPTVVNLSLELTLRNDAVTKANQLRELSYKITALANAHFHETNNLIIQRQHNASSATDDDDNDRLWNSDREAMQQKHDTELENVICDMQELLQFKSEEATVIPSDQEIARIRQKQITELQKKLNAQEQLMSQMEAAMVDLKQHVTQPQLPTTTIIREIVSERKGFRRDWPDKSH